MKTTIEKLVRILIEMLRVTFGALMLFASMAYFLNLIPEARIDGDMKTFGEGVEVAGYLMPLVKGIEFACGMLFIINRFVVLAALLVLPIVVNIVAVHLFIAPEGLQVALFLFIANVMLIGRHSSSYKGILTVKY